MKLKKLCTIGILTMLTLTGCKANNEEVVKNSSESDAIIESIEPESGANNSEDTEKDRSEESKINPNYANNEIYFNMYEDNINLDEIKSKNTPNGERDAFYLYEPDVVNGTDEVLKTEKKLVSSDLSTEEKLIILCDYLENKLGDIHIALNSNVDDKFAVVMAIEKYPAWGSNQDYRGGTIHHTLNQQDFVGEWFEHVEVIYDTGAFGDR